VLYVEDNDDNVFMRKMRLELLGDFEVLTAEDGEKGCAMAISKRPDLILMDLDTHEIADRAPGGALPSRPWP
jgi:CheY-like chemotaxis protein